MNATDLTDLFTGVTTFRKDGKRAPHKPLALLFALARVQSGGERLTPYSEMKEVVEPLLRLLWSSRNAHAMYPFWHLRSDGIWEVPVEAELMAAIAGRKNQKVIPDAVLLAHHAAGGFPEPVDTFLRSRPELVNSISDALLQGHFPASQHEDILDAVGMPWVVDVKTARRRDPRFREAVLRAYGRRCAICGYDGRIGEATLGIEAAHIQWHSAGGPDVEGNGLALCTFHHKAFDLGAIAVSTELNVCISPEVNGSVGVDEWLRHFNGREILKPADKRLCPSQPYLEWHMREVYRNPKTLSS